MFLMSHARSTEQYINVVLGITKISNKQFTIFIKTYHNALRHPYNGIYVDLSKQISTDSVGFSCITWLVPWPILSYSIMLANRCKISLKSYGDRLNVQKAFEAWTGSPCISLRKQKYYLVASITFRQAYQKKPAKTKQTNKKNHTKNSPTSFTSAK